MGFSIQDILGSTLFDSISKIIGQFHMSPEDKAKLQTELEAQRAAIQQAQDDYNVKLNDIAGANIRAEATGGPFERNARPAVIWSGLGFIGWNYCLVPTFGIHWHLSALNLPDAFWWTWGTVVTGYVFSRGAEKIAQMPGDSSIKLPFGIQVGQNSPKPN